jgi:hypothetical protein
MRGVSLLEVLHCAQGMQIVVKSKAVFAHLSIKRPLAGMPEGRVPDIVNQGKNLSEVPV